MSSLNRRVVFLRRLVLACLVFTGSEAASAAQSSGFQLTWRSEHNNSRELSDAFERLYVALYNAGNLPVKIIKDPRKTAQPLAVLLRREKLFFGSVFPVGMDAVLCDMNTSICKRSLKAISKRKLLSMSEHVGGYLKTTGRWSNRATTAITVPDLDFKTYTRIVQIPFDPNSDVNKLVADRGADCSQWNLSCGALVRRLNRAVFDTKRGIKHKPKSIKVPMVGYETQLVVTAAKHGKISEAFAELNSLKRSVEQQSNKITRSTRQWRSVLDKGTATRLKLDALKGNIQSFGKAGYQSFEDRHFDLQKDGLLKLINHPFSGNDEVPAYLKDPVPVAVFDFAYDTNHCELAAAVKLHSDLLSEAPPQFDRPQAAECGNVMDEMPTAAQDHGTHVTGLIASAMNTTGVVGLNPFAKLNYVALDSISLQSPGYRSQVANKIFQLGLPANFDNTVRVANISWRYDNNGGVDVIGQRIDNLKETTLFVVAAGNQNRAHKLTDPCNVFPACYGKKHNVITVVGLDRSMDTPNLWRENDNLGSNSSADFGVAAIASDILSTTYGNHTGRMSGTSQAAPQVSAAASLIYSRFRTQFEIEQPELLPVRVKNRLIYTSDLFNHLFTKVRGGRLNVGRALDMARHLVVIKAADGTRQVHHGLITKFGNFAVGEEYIECKHNNNQIQRINFVDLRRMFYDEPRRKYVVFFNAEPGNRDSPLNRISDCFLQTRTHVAVLESEDSGEEVSFKFRDIKDYLSPMF